jgi:hypothetical protein
MFIIEFDVRKEVEVVEIFYDEGFETFIQKNEYPERAFYDSLAVQHYFHKN